MRFLTAFSLDDWRNLAQIALLVVAVLAAIVGYSQLKHANRFELLKLLEDERFREARRLLWFEVCAKEPPPSLRWWAGEENKKLEQAAAKTCASFDIVALMAKYGNRRFFSKEWARSICWTYDLLAPYIADRHDAVAFKHYRALAEEARKYRP
jgi:hypothetical protein